jgi:regulator of sigma E protease
LENVNPSERTEGRNPLPDADRSASDPGNRSSFASTLFTVLLVAGCVVFIYTRLGFAGILNIALVVVGLSLVIFVHELGHFAVAKWCDVHVEAFSIGFGPAIPGCSFRRGETLYKIAWFPLGGYVKMVGEGPDDEGADDPRSFKNKTVGQRMLIISAGVIMNVIMAFICFIVVYTAHGVPQEPAEVDIEASGGAAWRAGLPTGSVITQIGDIKHPYFEDLLFAVVLSKKDQKIPFEYQLPGEPPRTVEIEPRREKDEIRPVIGVSPPSLLTLLKKPMDDVPLVKRDSAAAHANPPFEYGDAIVGTSDPDHPGQVTPLPTDSRDPDQAHPDYFAFRQRLERLAGQPMVIQVRRKSAGDQSTTVDLQVPPAYYYTFGMRMRMGKVTAIRRESPAARAGVHAQDPSQGIEGDLLDQVEVTGADGKKLRFVSSIAKPVPGVEIRELDPVRLPFELRQWAQTQKNDRKLRLTVLRPVERELRHPVTLDTEWDEKWQFNHEMPLYPASPVSIPELGIAYQVDTVVESVQPNSPAAAAGIKSGDTVKAIRFDKPGAEAPQPGLFDWLFRWFRSGPTPEPWIELTSDQWAYVFAGLQQDEWKTVSLRIEREGNPQEPISVAARVDETWPRTERGLILPNPEVQLQRANNFAQAIGYGIQRTYRGIVQIVLFLEAIVTRRVSPKAIGGPISIAKFAYRAASQDIYSLLLFLGVISINLAVFNFLPIPILDGGHMVFLLYEKIAGAPAPEAVRAIATYIGLMLILALMTFVIWVDVTR